MLWKTANKWAKNKICKLLILFKAMRNQSGRIREAQWVNWNYACEISSEWLRCARLSSRVAASLWALSYLQSHLSGPLMLPPCLSPVRCLPRCHCSVLSGGILRTGATLRCRCRCCWQRRETPGGRDYSWQRGRQVCSRPVWAWADALLQFIGSWEGTLAVGAERRALR